jgi:hypothetical protein
MSQRSKYLYATYATASFGGWPDTFYGYINKDKVILLRVTPFTVGSTTQYYPEIVVDGFTGVGTNPALFATTVGNGTATANDCQLQIQSFLNNGTD